MAVKLDAEPITTFEQWYDEYRIDERDGSLDVHTPSKQAAEYSRMYEQFKREMDGRVAGFEILEKLADNEVISPKPDLPNVSSGETAGLVRRMARNQVQNCPNVEVISLFDDDSTSGIFARHILTTKIIGSDEYSNDMQQNLFASTKTAITLGFACVIPALLQDAGGSWYIKYDAINYRDVYPEPGAKDIRTATSVFVRRYLTKGEVIQLIKDNTPGWDISALKKMLKNKPGPMDWQSVPQQTKKRHQNPDGYAVITWYSNSGEPFLTFSEKYKTLLRIEKNKHPMKEHPVFFLVLEKDDQQPLGKSQVEMLIGRQDFQDLMLNGAMKLWYRNINPSILGYGAVNTIPNLSPGKYTQVSNPNAKIEAFEVNTQTLMQYGQISQQNLGSMVNLVGAADQQMASQAGNGMSATPQGVEAQQQMVDITTNNYQKAIEAFFSRYCSYALTIFFQELKAVEKVAPTAEARLKLLEAGLVPEAFNDDGTLDVKFDELAVEYFVRTVPGSLVELEDEKQLRILNELFIPLSQAMPAIANAQDQEMMKHAVQAMQYIIEKQIELSGAASAKDIISKWRGEGEQTDSQNAKIDQLQQQINEIKMISDNDLAVNTKALTQMQEQMKLMRESQETLLGKLGVQKQETAEEKLGFTNSSNDTKETNVPSE